MEHGGEGGNLSFLIRDWTSAPCSGSAGLQGKFYFLNQGMKFSILLQSRKKQPYSQTIHTSQFSGKSGYLREGFNDSRRKQSVTRTVFCVCVCVCERECVCVRERERESVCVCVCVRERERERENEWMNEKAVSPGVAACVAAREGTWSACVTLFLVSLCSQNSWS